jgi:hypothetical protein
MKKVKNIIGFIILLVMAFLFLHSELDLFTPAQHNHAEHDFCDVVNTAKTENITINKLLVLNVDLLNSFLNVPVHVPVNTFNTIINPQKINTHNNFCILYNTFLI